MRPRHGEACRMPVPHHFFLSLKSFTYNTIGEDTDVFFSLYDTREGKQIRYNYRGSDEAETSGSDGRAGVIRISGLQRR